MKLLRRYVTALVLGFLVLAPMTVNAATHYGIIVSIRTSDGRLLWTLTASVDVEGNTLVLRVPQRLYDLVVSSLGTDTFTTPFSAPLAHGMLILTITSDPSGLTIRLVSVPAGEVVVDGRVNILDLASVGASFGRGPGEAGYNGMADFDLNGRVDIIDLAVVGMNYGRSL